MSKKTKIYVKNGIGFFVLFIASVLAVTMIQTANNRSDMERTLSSSGELGLDVVNNVRQYNESPDYSIDTLMWIINGRINNFADSAWNTHNIYSSVMLMDKNRNVISHSGMMLQLVRPDESDYSWYVPLEVLCSEEQKKLIYNTFRSEMKGSALSVSGEIVGVLDDFEQWIPQKLTLRSENDSSKNIILDFENESIDEDKLTSYSFKSAIVYIVGPNSSMLFSNKASDKILKECDALALRNIHNAQENQLGAGGTISDTRMTFDGIGTILIDNEPYYFAIGGQGFPLKSAIYELWQLYLFLFILMLVLFLVVSRGFVKLHTQQMMLEAERRRLTLNAADKLEKPLVIIKNCGAELRLPVSDEKRTELLNNIINETEQMDDTVRNLLNGIPTAGGGENEKG